MLKGTKRRALTPSERARRHVDRYLDRRTWWRRFPILRPIVRAVTAWLEVRALNRERGDREWIGWEALFTVQSIGPIGIASITEGGAVTDDTRTR